MTIDQEREIFMGEQTILSECLEEQMKAVD